MKRRSLARCAGAALLFSSGALALISAPTAAQLSQAATEGTQLASQREAGYPLRAYTLYAVQDTLKLEAKNGAVDAVTITTPYERTRYQAFISVLGEDPITPAVARQRAGLENGQIGIMVFAHGATPSDQKFLAGFTPASLKLGSQTLKPVRTERSGVSVSQYPKTVGEIGVRFVGTVTYVFQVPSGLTAGRGTVSLSDATGKSYVVPVDLTHYR
ncbi:hypothetical protein [Deinococcus sonorensis]|uniref:Uncharacterized protein n=2 Tax=Deinococcus sonorensis TaxID=309891 RepID=A0AAU7U5Z6_9DEIO